MNSLPSKRNVPVSFIIALFALIVVAQFLVFASPVHANATTTETTTNEILIVFEVNPDAAGSTAPSGNATYALGASISILATANSGYAFTGWTVSDASAITLADPSLASTTATVNDFGTITANFSPTTMKPADTQTVVTCDPRSVAAGSTTTCTATVSDGGSVSGQTVSLTSTGTGAFDSSDCALSSSGACSIEYTPTEVGDGSHTITANYAGDASHLNSTDSFTLTVTSGTVIVTTTTTSTAATSGLATVWTDQADYAPVDTPIIYGSGFLPNANITISVTRPEGAVNTWPTISDGSGGFQTTYATDGLVLGTFTVTATDGTNTATTTFTDSSTSLDPASGPVGTSVSVTGSGFTHAATVTIKYDGTTVVTYPATVTTDSSGHFSATITVPSSTAGSHTVLASDTGGKSDSQTFTVTASISPSPTSGPVGQSVTIAGSGFAASKTVTFTYGGSALTASPGTVTSDATGSFSGVTFTVPASTKGSHTVAATDASRNSASAPFTVTPSISRSPTSGPVGQSVTVTGTGFAGPSTITIKYDGTAVTTSPSPVTSSSVGSFSGVTFTVPASTAGDHTVSATDASSNSASATFTVTSAKSDQTITVTTPAPASAAYGTSFDVAATASSHLTVAITTLGTCSGSGSGSATITMTSGTGTCTVHYNQAGNADYNAAPQVTDTTSAQTRPVTVTADGKSKTYGDADPALTYQITSGSLVFSDVFAGALSRAAGEDVGTYAITQGTLALSSNYVLTYVGANFVITKADPTIVVTSYSVVYDGYAHTATGTATGVKGESLSGLDLSGTTHTNAGTYTGDAWTFTDVTGNYNGASGTVDDKISKADATIVVTPYDVTYDGNAHTATGSAKGVKGEDLSGLDLSGTTHTDAGTYNSDPWTFTDVTGNYNDASGTVDDNIDKADALVTVSGYTGVYDVVAHGASGSATGVGGVDLSGSLNLGSSFTNVPGGTADWTFTGGINYEDESGSVNIVISKATASVTPDAKNKVYGDADPILTGTLTGFMLADGVTATYSRAAGETVLGSPYTIIATLSPTEVLSNYDITHNTADLTITTRPITVTADAKSKTYGDTDPTLTYQITTGSLAFSDAFTGELSRASGEDVGTYAIGQNTLALSSNYDLTYVGADFVITKADAKIVVNGYTGVYDGDAHGASGTATGVNGEDLSSSLNLGDTFTDVPGGTALWTFTGGTNHNDANGDVAIVISKADATIVVTPYDVTYDGNAHTATGSATGVKGEALSGLDLSGTTHTNAGDYPTDAWTFTDSTGNYNGATGTVHDSIGKADATISVTAYSVTYDGNSHTATGTATGVKGEALAGLDLSGTIHTNAGDYPADEWTFGDVTGNYDDDSGTVHDVISRKALTITANSDSKTFGESYTFAGTEFTTLGLVNPPDTVTSVTLASDGAAATATVGSYDIVASNAAGTGLSNYDITYNKGILTVNQRPTTTTITPASAQYSDPITLIATVSPATAGGQTLTGSVGFFISGTFVGSHAIDISGVATVSDISNFRAASGYPVTATFTSSNPNFADGNGAPVTLTVTKENTAIAYTGDTLVFTSGTATSTSVNLAAHLTEESDLHLGDLSLAKVTFELTPSSGSPTTVLGVIVDASGDASTHYSLAADVWTVKVRVDSSNEYWTSPIAESVLTVSLPGLSATGGGWIPDSGSPNGKDNFGFTVNYNKNSAPKGSFVFVLRGTDGYDYVVKSNSWNQLSFTGTNKAYFTGKATVHIIERATGIEVPSWGNCKFAVYITDGDMGYPQNQKGSDTIAVTIFKADGTVLKQFGTSTSQIALGGGNIVVHSK